MREDRPFGDRSTSSHLLQETATKTAQTCDEQTSEVPSATQGNLLTTFLAPHQLTRHAQHAKIYCDQTDAHEDSDEDGAAGRGP